MAEIFNFYVQDNRTIQFPKANLLEPIMQEDYKVATWRFRIPKTLNGIDMSGWAWWFVYTNAKGQKFTELLTLVDDIDEPDSFCTADYDIDYRITYNPGSFSFSLEAINAESGGAITGEWHTKTYSRKVDNTLQGNQAQWAETESDIISALIIEVQNKVSQIVGGATPEPKNLVADMTDPKKVYLYVGSEEDESNGYWYYHNGTRFVPGGLYASGIIVDSVPTQDSTNAVRSGGVYAVTADLDARVEDLEQGGTGGLSMTAINLLNTILTEAVYGSDQTANIALLKKELSNIPPVSISAVLDGTALAGQSYSELSFVVTATFDDESTQVVDNYTIVTTGTVTAGSNTVTIRYKGITTTCTFTAEQVTTYTITYNLTNVASSSDVSVVRENAYYNTVLSVGDGYSFDSCTVTMGGVDITSTAFSNMEILITEVTGNVVITANATEITYMDDLIISRREFSGDLYSDNLVTKVGRMGGGVGVVAVSEYPALRDCEVTYTVTNNSGASVNLENQLGFGMIPSDNISNIHSGNKLINIPYWTKVSNSSGVLGDGESLTGTINLKAGYQLAMTAPKIAVYSALTVQLAGGYVADEFSGYEQITFSGASSNYGTYRAVSFYSDNGTTLIKTQSSSAFKLISDSISAGTYDVYMAVRGAYDASNIGTNIVYVGAVADATSTQSNYAFGLTVYADPNMWYHEQITVTDDGMAVIGYGSYLSTGTIVDMRMKEVSA